MKTSVAKKRVFVGLSGGVDSSVCAALLKQATADNFLKLFGFPAPEGFRGFDVTGVFIKVWHPDFLPCNWKEERRDAMRICAKLGIPFLSFDFEKEYKKEVVDYMIDEYKVGRTPNPDIMCNKYIKFGAFFDKAMAMGADYVATGHYARGPQVKSVKSKIIKPKNRSLVTSYQLLEGVDKNKDQSYFLWTLGQKELSHALFPVGGYEKPEVRKLAKKFGLSTAEKKDSQGLCFMGKVDMKDFLKHYIKGFSGKVIDIQGNVIGIHDGAIFYTIGQRHGFTINHKSANEQAVFVVAKDLQKNMITVSDKVAERDEIFNTKKVSLKNVNWISGATPDTKTKYEARIRYRQKKQGCKISEKNGMVEVVFNKLQNAVSPGQSLVLYKNENCLGGGVIGIVN